MPESRFAARLLFLLQRHNAQREADQRAREIESAIVHKVVEVVCRENQQALDSDPDHDRRAIPSPPSPPGLEDFDRRRGSGAGRGNGTNLVPSQEWETMDRDARELIRRSGKGERQRRRRRRITQQRREATAAAAATLNQIRWREVAAAAAMRGPGAHLDLHWQRHWKQPWQQCRGHEQQLPQVLQRSYGASRDDMCINFHGLYV